MEVFNYSKLRGKIREVYGTQKKFAKAMKIGYVSLSKRLNNSLDFSSREILNACELLNIDKNDITLYFFDEKVQKSEQKTA